MIKLASFDLDMTLLDHGTGAIPQSAMRTMEKLREQGCKIVIASGRDMDASYSTAYRDVIEPDAIIHTNGTRITVGTEEIYNHTMDKTLLKDVLLYAGEKGYGCGMSIGPKDYYVNPEIIANHDKKFWGQSDRQFEDPMELLGQQVRTLCYIGNEAGAKDMEAHFPALKLLMFAGKQGADVVEKAASKAEGLKRLCKYYGINIQDTAAFGDSMNDYEIVCAAGTGIAMGNAIEELKQVADYVTAPIQEHGIEKACRHFGWIK